MPSTARIQADVDADLSIASPVGPLRLTGQGGDLGLALPRKAVTLGLILRLLRHRRALRRLARGLNRVGTTLRVTRDGLEIARLGAALSPSWLARLLGLGPVALRPVHILDPALRRRGR